jgi:hypothetical protein
MIEKLGITPGPWKLDYDEVDDVVGSNWEYIVTVGGYNHRKDCELIAAAPDMLEALIDATIEILNTEQNEYRWSKEDAVRRNHGYISVIEKATGKTWEEVKELVNEQS